MLRVGIVANEASGDILGASLIRALKKREPKIQFEGVGGPEMIAAGCKTLFPLEKLSVMGIVEVLKHLPALLRIRRQLYRHFKSNPPDVFIGIDAPDFNLPLERRLKHQGITTIHYVSPSVWAWRQGRVKTIRKSVDLLLAILPFEQVFLEKHDVNCAYVGHPLADKIPLEVNQQKARRDLGLPLESFTVALLPGSRMSEVDALADPILSAAAILTSKIAGIHFIAPMINHSVRTRFEQAMHSRPEVPEVTLVDGRSRRVMAAADLVITASGTATLEAMLLKRPMVVVYRINPLSYWLLKHLKMVKTPCFSLANLLAGEPLAPELIQDAVTPEAIVWAVESYMNDDEKIEDIKEIYTQLHKSLKLNAGARAADAVLKLLQKQ